MKLAHRWLWIVLALAACAPTQAGDIYLSTGTHLIDYDTDGADLWITGDAHVTFASGAKAYQIFVQDDATL